tara:strand:- start:1145 stop:1666 length:522 start_codon:yes stop_codon:yes gene_type:complete
MNEPIPVTLDEMRYLLEAIERHQKKLASDISVNEFNKAIRQGEALLEQCRRLVNRQVVRTMEQVMIKKNQQPSQKISDGRSQDTKKLIVEGGLGFGNPGMRISTMKTMMSSIKRQVQELSGEATKTTVILTDSIHLLEALSIKYQDTPIVEVANMLLDDAHDDYEASKEKDNE